MRRERGRERTVRGRGVDEELAQRVVEEDVRVVRQDRQQRLFRVLVLDAQQLEALGRLVASELAARVDCADEKVSQDDEEAGLGQGDTGTRRGKGREGRTRGKVARLLLELRRDAVQPDLGERVEADADRDLAADGEALRKEEQGRVSEVQRGRGGRGGDAPCRSGPRGT